MAENQLILITMLNKGVHTTDTFTKTSVHLYQKDCGHSDESSGQKTIGKCLTYNGHDDWGLPGRDLLQEWEDVIHHQPAVQVLQDLAHAHQAVHPHLRQ